MKIFNSLSRKIEEFVPIKKGRVKMYSCGPTVYDYIHIGNWRTYLLGDVLVRVLRFLGDSVDYVMNITDVGHLVSDADEGEDKLEKGARREGKTAWEVADFYTKDFLTGFGKLNLVEPRVFSKATEHISEQIELVKKIEKAGLAYKIDDGIYFDVGKYELEGNKYGELSNLEEIKAGARVEINKQKKDPRDFALWKFSLKNQKRDMEWDSPWGRGFPGWHLECSAMSMKYLGEQFDIHVGGEDLKSTHHPNEVVQSEAATGKRPFVKYWLHGAFLQVDGGKMSKSLGNTYSLQEIEKRGLEALDLRYFFLTGHYRKQMNFTWEALRAARTARKRLASIVAGWEEAAAIGCAEFEANFQERIEADLDMPGALAVVWDLVKSDYPDRAKKASLLKMDRVLGLGLDRMSREEIPAEIEQLIKTRQLLRQQKKWDEADLIREKIEKAGFRMEDKGEGKVKIESKED